MDEARTTELFEESHEVDGIPEEGMLERIRDILLGHEREALDHRFQELEQRLFGQLEEHRRSTLRRFEKLELALQRELEELGGKLQNRTQEFSRKLDQGVSELGDRIASEARERSRELEKLEGRLESRSEELGRRLEEESKERNRLLEGLGERFRTRGEELEQQLREEAATLAGRCNLEKEDRTRELKDLRGEMDVHVEEVRRVLGNLERRTLDRRALSELLLESAMRLTAPNEDG